MDLGTNSFHLLIADAQPDGHIDPIVQEKEMLRLGDVVSAYGSIPPTAAEQAVATVRRFRLLADAAGADEIHARATSAIRRAENGGELVDRIEEETGVVVDVISGLEEARSSSARSVPPSCSIPRPRCASTSAGAASRSWSATPAGSCGPRASRSASRA